MSSRSDLRDRLRRWPALIALSFCLACTTARPLGEAETPVLGPDEGILVLHTDSVFGAWEIGVHPGWGYWQVQNEEAALVVLPAGEYRFRHRLSELPADPRFSFEVRAGTLSYPGSLVIRPVAHGLGLRTANRSGTVLPLIRERYSRLQDLPLVHTGRVRDDFFEHYERLRAEVAALPREPEASAAPLRERSFSEAPAEPFFRASELREVTLSPAGTWLALLSDRGSQRVVTIRHRSGLEQEVMWTPSRIREIAWNDDDSLLVLSARGDRPGPVAIWEFDVREFEGRIQTRRRALLPVQGHVVHPLPDRRQKILFHPLSSPGSVLEVDTSRVHEQGRVEGREVASLPGPVDHWLTDRKGVVRAAVVIPRGADSAAPESLELWYRDGADQEWRLLASSPLEALAFEPIGFDLEDRLVVKSDQDRDRFALFALDTGSGELGPLIYEHPTAQITEVRLEDNGGMLAVGVFENGQARYEYLQGVEARDAEVLARFFPGQNVTVASASLDRSRYALFVNSPGSPGQYFVFDARAETAEPVGSVAPWLDAWDLATVRTFRSRSEDGVEVESFLTLPVSRERPPLVVMPHGGPIGVSETGRFDPEAQFLAASGFAVLKVNFRGSSGYGKAHFEAGKLQWGTGIENDIDAAIRDLLSMDLVDAERICIAGGSYGGYSALMSAIRWPLRFRCVAALAGVTDIPLMFNSSDFAWREPGRRAFAELVGDPDEDYDTLKSKSPVYRAQELRAPVFLAHGARDDRVDVDHAHRLERVLALRGHPTEFWILRQVGHSFRNKAQLVEYYERLRDFLARHLLDPEP